MQKKHMLTRANRVKVMAWARAMGHSLTRRLHSGLRLASEQLRISVQTTAVDVPPARPTTGHNLSVQTTAVDVPLARPTTDQNLSVQTTAIPFCLIVFCLLALSSKLFPENSSIFLVKR